MRLFGLIGSILCGVLLGLSVFLNITLFTCVSVVFLVIYALVFADGEVKYWKEYDKNRGITIKMFGKE